MRNTNPQLAAFPKAFMDQLTLTGEMTLRQWFDICAELKVDGTELYSGFKELQDPKNWPTIKKQAADRNLPIPMLCCSPDFTHPDPKFRQQQIDQEKKWIDMAAALGSNFCRVLSGQRRPEISRADGIRYAADSIQACIPHAAKAGIKLIIENH